APLRRLDIPKALAIVVDHYLAWLKLVKSFRLSIPLQQLHELIRRDYGSEIAVDAVHGGGFVFGALAARRVADDDRQVPVIPGRTDVAFHAPIEVDPRKHDHFHPFAS